MINYQDIGKLVFFDSLSEPQLKWVAENSKEIEYQPGENLFNQGEPAEALWVLLEGEWRMTLKMGSTETILLTTSQPGTWVGGYVLMDGTYQATVTALQPLRVLYVHNSAVKYMLTEGFPVALHLINGLVRMTRNMEARVTQFEKMASLGKLAAGLAHELNNPAAAGNRAANQLRAVLAEQETLTLDLAKHLDQTQVEWLKTLLSETAPLIVHSHTSGGLEQSEREDAIAGWLEDRGLSEAWNLAPALVEAGLEVDWLEKLKEHLGTARLEPAVKWFETNLRVNSILSQLEQSTGRISTLVKTVKMYSFMDQAPRQEVDLHAGLESSLSILSHKVKPQITIIREYDKLLPRINAFGSELNQVWTNLLDNALDALNGQGEIRLRTWQESQPHQVVVEIGDNGPGIPPEIQSRIFEPFYTTKEVGKGTGLGLDIAYRIIVTNHHGEIKVSSQPGQTLFQVFLPVVMGT
jgi:signal transduction histidine kinase